MMDWIPTEQTPPAPGYYWTAKITYTPRDQRGVREAHYHFEWRRWNGMEWDTNDFTHWHGERVVNARAAW